MRYQFYINPSPMIFSMVIALLFCFTALESQRNNTHVYVDEQGIMRYTQNDEEITGFGVNYTVPFAHAYRSARKMGIDVKSAMDGDVYHFARLGFDLFRVHVWDTEISDTLGNLLNNEHLDAFDYLIHKLKERGIRSVITPIAFWGNGWPEPDEKTPGFSHKYGKNASLTDPIAILAQQNYLFQFMNHVNPYTGLAYKDDETVLAVEISNEPHHREEAGKVTTYIKSLVNAIRRSGSTQPIFYNVTHAVHLAEAYFEAGIQGGTFQWYPTGLGYKKELQGNYLPNVNHYDIVFDDIIKKYKGAKLVYEFDAADIGRSYIYPAMARSFREAGIQLATYFSYDPTFLGHVNTEYNTHYMNLAYTPQKALSLMICGEVFRNLPLYENQGTYPDNQSFYGVSIDYPNDLAEYNTAEKFIYTNNTSSKPIEEESLSLIAGFGNSSVVQYDGMGAYFLDKIEEGIWRLEVMPDAIWIDNPFGNNSPDQTLAVIHHRSWDMTVSLNDLNTGFSVTPVHKGFYKNFEAKENTFSIKPGVYLLTSHNKIGDVQHLGIFKNGALGETYAPASSVTEPHFIHEPVSELSEKIPHNITIQYIAPIAPQSIHVHAQNANGGIVLKMERNKGYEYSATIPEDKMTHGFVRYQIVVHEHEGSYTTYPAGKKGKPSDWDFYDRSAYEIRVVPGEFSIELFDAYADVPHLMGPWRRTLKLVPGSISQSAEYQVVIDNLFMPDSENLNAPEIYDYSFKLNISDKMQGRENDLTHKKNIILEGRSLTGNSAKFQVALTMNNGSSFGGLLELNTTVGKYYLPLESLEPVKTVLLPRPYPTFLPYYFDHALTIPFDIRQLESVQISLGPGLDETEKLKQQGIGIQKIYLK